MSDNARTLFEQLQSETDLKDLIEQKVREGLFLEFKLKRDPKSPKLDDDDRKNISKSISGFANSGGGVLIFGIKDKDGVATKLVPISMPDQLAEQITSVLPHAVEPVPSRLELEAIYADSKSSGYVKCLVPESDSAPHRALRAGREYYKRSGSSFYMLEHFDLEDMFGRRQRPALELALSATKNKENKRLTDVSLLVRNNGRAVGRHVSIVIRFDDDAVKVEETGRNLSNLTEQNKGIPAIQYINNEDVVHPSPAWHYLAIAVIRTGRRGVLPTFSGVVYCENMRPVTIEEQVISVDS